MLESFKRKKEEELLEEQRLRGVIRKIILTEASGVSDEVPHSSTGINVLRDLFVGEARCGPDGAEAFQAAGALARFFFGENLSRTFCESCAGSCPCACGP